MSRNKQASLQPKHTTGKRWLGVTLEKEVRKQIETFHAETKERVRDLLIGMILTLRETEGYTGNVGIRINGGEALTLETLEKQFETMIGVYATGPTESGQWVVFDVKGQNNSWKAAYNEGEDDSVT